MSRSDYSDDIDQWASIRWRGAVNAAIRGKRGQKLLRELRDALDAMPDKRLIAGDLLDADGEVCAMGAVGLHRNIPMADIDPEDPEQVAKAFNIAEAMAREIAYENDEGPSNPESRWVYMRRWCEGNIYESV